MYRFKEIKKALNDRGVSYWEDNNKIFINWCEVGDNFYDYGEDKPDEMRFDSIEIENILANDDRIIFITCEGCCGCAGW